MAICKASLNGLFIDSVLACLDWACLLLVCFEFGQCTLFQPLKMTRIISSKALFSNKNVND